MHNDEGSFWSRSSVPIKYCAPVSQEGPPIRSGWKSRSDDWVICVHAVHLGLV